MNTEYHITSFIVFTRPEVLGKVCDCINALPGAEVHQYDASGKIIITIEADSTAHISETTQAIGLLPGVLACNMVYHQFDDEDSRKIEVAHEN